MNEINIQITEEEAVVLFEFFERFKEEKERLYFVHPAEYLSLMKISAQIDKNTSAIFDGNYQSILEIARARIAKGFEGNFPVIEKE